MFDMQKPVGNVNFDKQALQQFATIGIGEDIRERVNNILTALREENKPMSIKDLFSNPNVDDTKNGIKYIVEVLKSSGFLMSEVRDEENIEVDGYVQKCYSDVKCSHEVPEKIEVFSTDGKKYLIDNPEAKWFRDVLGKITVQVRREYYWINPRKALALG